MTSSRMLTEYDYSTYKNIENYINNPDNKEHMVQQCVFSENGHTKKHLLDENKLYQELLYRPNKVISMFCDIENNNLIFDKKQNANSIYYNICAALDDLKEPISRWLYKRPSDIRNIKQEQMNMSHYMEDSVSFLVPNKDQELIDYGVKYIEGQYDKLSIAIDMSDPLGIIVKRLNNDYQVQMSSCIHIELKRNKDTEPGFYINTAYPCFEIEECCQDIDFKIDVQKLTSNFKEAMEEYTKTYKKCNEIFEKILEAENSDIDIEIEKEELDLYLEALERQIYYVNINEGDTMQEAKMRMAFVLTCLQAKKLYEDNPNIKIIRNDATQTIKIIQSENGFKTMAKLSRKQTLSIENDYTRESISFSDLLKSYPQSGNVILNINDMLKHNIMLCNSEEINAPNDPRNTRVASIDR